MEMKKLLLKGSLLLGSAFLLAACGNDEPEVDTSVESSVVESVEEVEEVEEVSTETSEESEETSEESEETSEESEETSEESEETSEESEETSEESEETSEESEETSEESEETSEESEETSEESEETSEESEETSEESEETSEESEETSEESEETSEESEETSEESEETSEESEETTEVATLVDGEYTSVSNEDENGWSVQHMITVEDGEVTVSEFDYVNADGDLKSEDEEYNTMMEENSGISAADAMEQLNTEFVESQSADVDVVSGATSTSESFAISAAALLDAAAEGNTDEINIDELDGETEAGELQDGEYTLTTEADERGWSHQFMILVEDGEITESNYDMVNEDGDLKSEDEEYNTAMEEGSGTSFATAAEELNAALVEAQTVEGIEVVSGATSTSNAFLEYAKQLVDAATEGNTDPIEAELVE